MCNLCGSPETMLFFLIPKSNAQTNWLNCLQSRLLSYANRFGCHFLNWDGLSLSLLYILVEIYILRIRGAQATKPTPITRGSTGVVNRVRAVLSSTLITSDVFQAARSHGLASRCSSTRDQHQCGTIYLVTRTLGTRHFVASAWHNARRGQIHEAWPEFTARLTRHEFLMPQNKCHVPKNLAPIVVWCKRKKGKRRRDEERSPKAPQKKKINNNRSNFPQVKGDRVYMKLNNRD